MECFMAKQTRTYSSMTKEALTLMGKQIQLARKARHMSAKELAERSALRAGGRAADHGNRPAERQAGSTSGLHSR
jgi:hypothetical protein